MAKCNYLKSGKYTSDDKICGHTGMSIKYNTDQYYSCCNNGKNCEFHPKNSGASLKQKRKMYQDTADMSNRIRTRNAKVDLFWIISIIAVVIYFILK